MKLLTHTRYATVASTAALVIALGGTSYAAVKITGSNIADCSITTKDVKNNSLSLKDLSKATKGRVKGVPGLPRALPDPRDLPGFFKDGPSYTRSAYDFTATNITNQVSGDDPPRDRQRAARRELRAAGQGCHLSTPPPSPPQSAARSRRRTTRMSRPSVSRRG